MCREVCGASAARSAGIRIEFRVTLRKYLVLAGVSVFGATGDAMLSHGMKQTGNISLHQLHLLFLAVLNPWVAVGILLLLAFFAAYMNALSWADLTYVLPASSMGYVVLALTARFLLHEQVSPMRWMGIVLISGGVGFVTQGPALTSHHDHDHAATESSGDVMVGDADEGERELACALPEKSPGESCRDPRRGAGS